MTLRALVITSAAIERILRWLRAEPWTFAPSRGPPYFTAGGSENPTSPRRSCRSALFENCRRSSPKSGVSMNQLYEAVQSWSLARLLRLIGGSLLLCSATVFMLQRWSEGNDLLRYGILLGHSVFLAGAAHWWGFRARDSSGARSLGCARLSVTDACPGSGTRASLWRNHGDRLVPSPDRRRPRCSSTIRLARIPLREYAERVTARTDIDIDAAALERTPDYDENGVDRSQIREMLRLAPAERLSRVDSTMDGIREIWKLNGTRPLR